MYNVAVARYVSLVIIIVKSAGGLAVVVCRTVNSVLLEILTVTG